MGPLRGCMGRILFFEWAWTKGWEALHLGMYWRFISRYQSTQRLFCIYWISCFARFTRRDVRDIELFNFCSVFSARRCLFPPLSSLLLPPHSSMRHLPRLEAGNCFFMPVDIMCSVPPVPRYVMEWWHTYTPASRWHTSHPPRSRPWRQQLLSQKAFRPLHHALLSNGRRRTRPSVRLPAATSPSSTWHTDDTSGRG